MKKVKLIFMLVLCSILIMGCAESKILERVSLVTLIGYDLEEENKVTTTSVIRQINPEFQSKVEVQSATEGTSKGTRIKVDMKTAKKIAAGQLRVVLFGEELAENGLNESIHTLMMNNELSTSVYLAVVRGTSKSILEYKYNEITDLGQHIYNLIDHNVKQEQTISSTTHEIARDYYSKDRHFALPILAKNGEFVQIDGMGFFSSGKMVGELPADDMLYIMMMQDNFKNGKLDLGLDGESVDPTKFKDKELQIAVDSIKTIRGIKVVNPDKNEFDLTVKMKCRLLEISSEVSTSDVKVLNKIEKSMSKKIESELSRILEYSQEINSDIYGFGEQYRAQVRGSDLTEEKWTEKYQEMKVNINVDVEIIRNGVFE